MNYTLYGTIQIPNLNMQSTANHKALFLLFNNLSKCSFQHLKLNSVSLKVIDFKLTEAKDSNRYNLDVLGGFIAQKNKDNYLCYKVKIKLLIAFVYT